MLKETEILIRAAHQGYRNAVARIWNIHGDEIMRAALIQSHIWKPDFSLRGKANDARIRHISGQVYENFADLVYAFDPDRNDDFLGFVYQHVKWLTLTEKRNNAKLYTREVYGVEIPETAAPQDDYERVTDYRTLVKRAGKVLKSNKVLSQNFEEHRKVCGYMEKGEIVEVSDRLGCTRATVYNRNKASRKYLQDGADAKLHEEIMLVLAA